ncbi:phage tail protein [Enterobacter hormaechei]|nr:phage tail protein [Enterobacter hormaechei]ELZ5060795.1 phage tail protein [Enterobacter hormaechei]MCM7025130.1 phage tail protein [Enterobacter hormaechei]MCM7033646.1 phage tail protein [Enterobacter hormaechei]MDP5225335.1 phage tail protein [Enterobacter hormaechei]MDS0009189.1 phage tail protein [Enterobacter hormaechei subsp. xiangfangensis]
MLYNTGTIAINGNTATGTGTNWTAPASQIRVGQTLFVLSNPVQMFQITAINSATSLTVTPAASPALSGQKYGILVTDSLSVDGLAQSMSQLINEYDENIGAWETFATISANQNITVTINGTRVTIPAIGKLAQKGSNGAIPIGQGGTGATNVADARTNLGLGSSATKDVGTATDNVLQVGAFGLGATLNSTNARPISPGSSDQPTGYGYWSATENIGAFPGAWQGVINVRTAGAIYSQLAMTGISTARMAIRVSNGSNGFTGWSEFYTTTNTTKASDGTLKAASPVARIVKSLEECQRTDIDEAGFVWCGCGTANDEAEGITLSRLDIGVYVLTGSAGLASEGWQLLPPMDPGGMGELGVVEAEQTENGGLTIRLFKRKYMLSDEGEIVKTKGEPMDVPVNSWIDVRLDMPDDSAFNQMMNQKLQP